MSDPTSQDSHETLQELATSRPLTRCQNQQRQAGWVSRTATTLGLALIVAASVTGISPPAFAESAMNESSAGAGSSIVRDPDTLLDSIFEKIRNELDRRVQMKTEAIIRQITEAQINTLLRQFEQNLTIPREISTRVERQLAELIE